jgi:hypothetical protein
VDDNGEIQVTKLVKMTPHNLRVLLYDLRVQSQTFPAGEDVDAHPISKNAFGRSLTGQGHVSFYKSVQGKNVRHWQFPRADLPNLQADVPTELDPDSSHPKMGDPDFSAPEAPPLDPDLWEG